MNFMFEYIDPFERTQGSVAFDSSSSSESDNQTYSGGLGMLQRRVH